MVQETPVKNDFIFLVQTKSKHLERLLSNSVEAENIHLETVESSTELSEQRQDNHIITFIIGSDVEDPIRSAQRFHAYKKTATIVLLAKAENIEPLKEAVKFSPFIGTNIICLDESKVNELKDKFNEILRNSQRSEKYRDILAETNAQLSSRTSPPKTDFHQNFINKLMDIAPIGIAIVNRNGNVLGWNKKADSMFRKNEAQVLGTSLSSLFEPPQCDKLEAYIKHSFKEEKVTEEESLSLKRRVQGAHSQVLSFTATPFTYLEGAEKGLILAIRDVTKSVQLLNQLKSEVNSRDNFLSMASHELRTPLTAMRINLELLKETIKRDFSDASGSPDNSLSLSDKSLSQANRLNNLIEDLFDVAKIHSGKLDFNLDRFNLSEFLERYMLELENRFKAANSELELDIEPEVIGTWDKNRIQQALSNIINNTLKYAPSVPVKVSLKTAGNWACLSVHDKGPGISKEKQEKIFDRFERATDSKTISGLGLGLFIAKKIVEGHAGNIEIQSSPGEGATFILKLPMDLDPDNRSDDLGVRW